MTLAIPARDEAGSIETLLLRVAQQTLRPSEILLVDAGSVDETVEIAAQSGDPNLRVLAAGPAYPGKARNRAMLEAKTDWVAFVDAGCLPASDWLEQLVAAAEAAGWPDALVLGGYDPGVRTEWDVAQALCLVAPKVDGLRGPSTASLLMPRSVWEKVGRFREDLRAAEDLAFFERARALGVPRIPAANARVEWSLAPGPIAAWRRLRTYSLHHLRAGLGRTWHLRVMGMDIVLCGLTGLGLAAPAYAVAAGSLALLRLLKTVWTRRGNVDVFPFRPDRLARVALLLVLADAAVWHAVISRLAGRK